MRLGRLTLAATISALLWLTLVKPSLALNPLDIVKRSQVADLNVSYRGFKYADISVGKQIIRAQFKIVHRKPDHTRIDYHSPSELAGIITIERGADDWRYIPSQQRWHHNKWYLSPENVQLALKNYKIINAGKEKIVGRSAYVIKLMPKKPGNPSQTIWIDDTYYLVLKSELRNSSGIAVSTSVFKSITFEPKDITDAAFMIPTDVKPPNNPVPDLGFKVVKPKYIPKGYSFVQTSTVPIGKLYAAHLMYTNGINTISIFERKRDPKGGGDWKSGLGDVAKVVRFDYGQITFTIIGDIDKRELQKIANSLK
jgi:outer membrane lipoprotein-sorting protein